VNKKEKEIIYLSDSPAKTKKLGELLAKTILKSGTGGQARVLLLQGDLGAGKTQFTQGLAKGFGVKETVNSPTFTIIKKYPVAGRSGFCNFYHIDCYRLNSGRDLGELGMGAVLNDPANIVALEWPAVVENDLPFGEALVTEFKVCGENERMIKFSFTKPNEK